MVVMIESNINVDEPISYTLFDHLHTIFFGTIVTLGILYFYGVLVPKVLGVIFA